MTWSVIKVSPKCNNATFTSPLLRTNPPSHKAFPYGIGYSKWLGNIFVEISMIFIIQSRCMISGAQVLAAYFALQQMPISVQKIIISARPIFTVVLARLFLKEPFGKLDVRENVF